MTDIVRAAIASRLFVPEVSAGAFRLGALARGMTAAGAGVDVVTTTPPPQAPHTPDPDGVRVHRMPALRDRGGNIRGYVQYASFDAPLLFRLLRRPWDVVVAESPPTTALVTRFAAWLRRRPYVYYAADVWTDGVIAMGAPRPVIALMRVMERAALRGAAGILSVSEEVTRRLCALGADPARITTVGNGIDTTVFRPDTAARDGAGRYFVYTGTMSEWQRPDVFIRAFARIADESPDVALRFFGQGAVEHDLRVLAEELVPGRVAFGGVVPPPVAASWIRGAVGALVSIAPGIGYDFARPTKTYAAAACGTPVLFAGADVGGALVRDNGLGVATSFTADAVADAMRQLLREHTDGVTDRERARRSRWARDTVSLDAAGRRAAEAVLAAAQVS